MNDKTPLPRVLPRFLLAFVLAAFLLPAAGVSALPPLLRVADSAPGADQSEAAALAAAGSFTAALSADVQGLDPALLTDGPSLLVTSQIYDTLVAYEPGGSKPISALAESWSVSSDGKTWTFNLRPGITFHDGTSLNAAAVAFNFQRWWDPANAYHVGNFDYFEALFGGFKGDAGCLLAGVGATGSLAFQITTTQPDSALPTRLAADALAIASPAAIQAGTLGALPRGTGPYRFVERVAGDHISLQANAAYWGGAPVLDGLTFRVITDPSQRYAALAAGTVQSADAFDNAQVLAAASNSRLRVLWRLGASVGYLGINSAHGPLGNLLVRQAIAHAVDWQTLIANHYGVQDELAGQFLPPAIWGHDPTLQGYTYDPALARSLLAQAGYSGGFATTVAYRNVVRGYLPDPAGTANAIAADLQAVGIDADAVEYASGEFLDKVHNGELDLHLLGWGAEFLHPASFFALFCSPTNLEFGPLDTDLCNQLDAAGASFDFADQLAKYTWISDRVYDTLPLAPLAHRRSALITRGYVAGLVPSPMAAENYEVVRFVHRVYLPIALR